MLPRWFDHALKDKGLHEIPGPEHNHRILEMTAYTTLHARDDETAWCSSAMNCWMAESGLPYTKSAAARSWLKWGIPLETPEPGCVVILNRGGSPDPDEAGPAHVCFFYEDIGNGNIRCYGGNQSDQVKFSVFRKNQVLGYRWPKED